MTQLCWEMDSDSRWWMDAIRGAGIWLPVDVGIMPVLDAAATINMALSRNGCVMPRARPRSSPSMGSSRIPSRPTRAKSPSPTRRRRSRKPAWNTPSSSSTSTAWPASTPSTCTRQVRGCDPPGPSRSARRITSGMPHIAGGQTPPTRERGLLNSFRGAERGSAPRNRNGRRVMRLAGKREKWLVISLQWPARAASARRRPAA